MKGHELYNEYLDELEFADKCGFDGICVNEHHQNAYGTMPSPNIMLASMVRRTQRANLVVLDGTGTVMLGDKEHAVRRGHVVARPAATRVAHSFRAGDDGLTMLAYGTRKPNDIAYYPRSNKTYFRGVGVMIRAERLDYWDGEEE